MTQVEKITTNLKEKGYVYVSLDLYKKIKKEIRVRHISGAKQTIKNVECVKLIKL